MSDGSFRAIETSRLRVRRFQPGDAAALARYRADPEVARYQAWESCSEQEAAAFIASLSGTEPGTAGTWFQFAFELRDEQQLVGDCGLRATPEEPRQAELGFTLARRYQGRGLAAEGVAGVLEYAFSTLALHRVFAITDERNAAAQRLLAALGFRREARFVEAAWFKGAWATELLYALLEREFEPPA